MTATIAESFTDRFETSAGVGGLTSNMNRDAARGAAWEGVAMIFDLLGITFLDGGIAAVFNTPFIIPVAGGVMVGCIVVASVWAGVRSQEIKSQERLARIAQVGRDVKQHLLFVVVMAVDLLRSGGLQA